ncbi:LemA family protein [Phycisphaera mikurensis]|uniref:LemA family protein n=1 Tax=Phycisphaera mikurensis (strain NBRC 102666 / KCTC 22515 / FYK2301M01) TaxID=1142394 RepID=I0II88_PHYMF|nr:LemA family protein [Phycisphaera mikurensis]MBB6442461.1 LemA protein [Phycisphaera mikurensis]BAM04976.1 LemA family protein [Phycisphaera mikurensis NBRC 102666]
MGTTLIIVLVVAAVLLAILAFWAMGIYNRLTTLYERTKNGFAQIDVQLERRYDLIPNLVETAKGYMAHEKETLDAVTSARASATQARVHVAGDPTNGGAMQELGAAEGQLTQALGKLMMVSEAYPELKANQNMMQLTEELTSTENKVAFARQAYNDSVNSYQTYKKTIPPVLIAGVAGFQDAEYLEIEESVKREAPAVKF